MGSSGSIIQRISHSATTERIDKMKETNFSYHCRNSPKLHFKWTRKSCFASRRTGQCPRGSMLKNIMMKPHAMRIMKQVEDVFGANAQLCQALVILKMMFPIYHHLSMIALRKTCSIE